MTCNSVAATAAAVEAAKVATRGIMASNLKYNAIIIGWLCVIISTVMILSSMMIINMQTNVEVLFKDLLLRQASDKEMLSITNLLAAFGTVAFAMALINFGVSLLLLIGVARNSSKLMLPWLIYHGIVFSFNLFLAIFYAIVGLFIDLSSFLMCLLVFILVLARRLPYFVRHFLQQRRHHKHHKQQQHQQQQQQQPELESEKETLPYRVEHSEIYGRYLVANRQLEAGELLISEEPLAIGPCVSCEPVCLGCYQPVQLDLQQYRCPGCKWPLCGPSCRGLQQSTGHSPEECQLYKERQKQSADVLNKSATLEQVRDLYELVLIVRIVLLKQHAPEQYAQIRRMESHTEERRENPTLWQHYEQKVVKRLRDDWQLAAIVDELELHEICGILDVNCFEIGQRGAKARTLYPSAFLLAHDCSPNTAHTDDPQTFAILLRTSRRVREQDALTLSYAYTLQGTLKRRTFIQGGKLFWCQCQRCADPRELCSDCSALVCKTCLKGSIRATAPLEQTADWACDHCDCHLTAVDLERLLDRINDDLESIDVHDIAGLENFLTRYREVLRPNHYLLLSAKYSLCQIYGRIEGYLLPQMSPEDIARKERYCREFLAIIDLLEPGLTRLRGLIMYELHAPIMVLAQLGMQNGQLGRQEFQKRIKEVTRLLKESAHILQLEPPGSTEHEMGLAAAEALTKMGC